MRISKRLFYFILTITLLLSVTATSILIQIENKQIKQKSELVDTFDNSALDKHFPENKITFLLWLTITIDVLLIFVLLYFTFKNDKRLSSATKNDDIKEIDNILKYISDTNIIGYWETDNKENITISDNCFQLLGIENKNVENSSYQFISDNISELIHQLKETKQDFTVSEIKNNHPDKGEIYLAGIANKSHKKKKENHPNVFGLYYEIPKRKILELEKRSNELTNWYNNTNVPLILFKPIYNKENKIIDLIFNYSNSLLNDLLEIYDNNLVLTKYSENQHLGEIDIILSKIQNITEEKSILINTYNPSLDKYFTLRAVLLDKFKFAVIVVDHTKVIYHINSIKKNLDLYKNIFELTDCPTIILDSETLFLEYCNTSSVKLFQAKSKEALCAIDFELLSHVLQENEINNLERIKSIFKNLKNGQISKYENWTFVKTNGENFSGNISFFKLTNGSKEYICISINDISNIRQIKENYEKSQKWMQTIMDSVLSIIVVKDIYGKIISCNNTYKNTFGHKSSLILGKYNEDIYTKEEAVAIRSIDNEIIMLGIERTYEQQLYTRENIKKIFLISKKPLKDENGKVYAIVAQGTDISAIKTLENKLYHAQLEAVIANNAKSQFLTNMSHEIRTPINAIIGYSELLQKRDYDEKTTDYINSIYGSGNSLLGLINHILELSKIEAGKIEVYTEYTDIIHVLNTMKDMFKLKAEQKGLNLIFEIKNKPEVWFDVDVQKLKQILINLIGNAIKFTQKGSVKVIFDYYITNDDISDIEIKVIDTGIGISESNAKILFKPFVQIDSDTSNTTEGTGLGLNISRQLAKLMNGRIDLISTQNTGSEFTVLLKNVNTRSDKSESFNIEDNNLDYVFEKSKILIVDDNEDNRKIIVDILNDYNFITLEGTNGREGIELALKHKPDLILLDIRMPDLNGYKVSAKIKELTNNNEIKIIAYTAVERIEQDKDFNPNLFDDKLIKPINKNKLFKILAKYIKHETIGLKKELNITEFNFNNKSKKLIKETINKHGYNQIYTNRELKEILLTIKKSKEYDSDNELTRFIDSFWNAIEGFNVIKTDHYTKIFKEVYNEV